MLITEIQRIISLAHRRSACSLHTACSMWFYMRLNVSEPSRFAKLISEEYLIVVNHTVSLLFLEFSTFYLQGNMDKCYNKHLVSETFLLELMHRIVFIELRGVVFSFYTFIPDYIPFFISITIKPYSLRVRSVEQYQPHTVYIY